MRARGGTSLTPLLDPIEEVYRALTTGLGDYVRKNGFQSVVIGLSGGIDSALTAAIAADALGPEAVWGVAMPSRFSSQHSIDDAHELASNLGIRFDQVPVDDVVRAAFSRLSPHCSWARRSGWPRRTSRREPGERS